MKQLHIGWLSILVLLTSFQPSKPDAGVTFPGISEPIQLTSNGKEHFFASYYGMTSGTLTTPRDRAETDIKHKLPDENDPLR